MAFLAVQAQTVVPLAHHEEHGIARNAREFSQQASVAVEQGHVSHAGRAQLYGFYAQPVGLADFLALGKAFFHQAGQQAVHGGALQAGLLDGLRQRQPRFLVFAQQAQQLQGSAQTLRPRGNT
ncbi:hypothetical protein D3C78_1250670 [compost metagenome]